MTADEIYAKQIQHERIEKMKRDRLNGLLDGLGRVEKLDWTHGKETTDSEYHRGHCAGDLAKIMADAEHSRRDKEAQGDD